MIHQLSRTDARRIAVRVQLLAKPRPTDLMATVRQLSLLQLDITKAVAPSADLVLWSRLGSAYDVRQLRDAVNGQALVELRGSVRPAEDIALYRARMAEWLDGSTLDGWRKARREWVDANKGFRRDILAALRSDGPLRQRELPDTCVRPWQSTGWNNNRNVAMMLDLLTQMGEVAVAGWDGRDKLWDLAERVYPDVEPVPTAEAERQRDCRRLSALGIARPKGPECAIEPLDVGEAGEPAVVDGVRGEWRVDPAQLGQPFHGRAALLSPFDRLLHDRKRMNEVFEFDYYVEMFKPAAQRRWGYYALPILYGDQLVGKLDATTDLKAGELRVNAIHRDVEFSKAMVSAVDREVDDLARWLQVVRVG